MRILIALLLMTVAASAQKLGPWGWMLQTNAVFNNQSNSFLGSINLNGNSISNGSFIGNGGSVTNLEYTNYDNPTFLATVKGLESGTTFSNVNRHGWANWYSRYRATAGNASTQTLAIAALTDGLGGSINLMTSTMNSPTNFGLPVVGYFGGFFPQWVGFVGGTATQAGEHTGLWYPTWFNLAAQNDSVTFSNFFGVPSGFPAGPTANAGTVYYVKEPGAGTITIATNLNGGAFSTLVSGLAAANASMDAGIYSWTNTALGQIGVRVTQTDVGKSVKILYPKVWNNFSNGIITATFQGSASDSVADMLTTNLLFSGKVWADLNPVIILYGGLTVIDAPSATTCTNFQTLCRFLKTNFVSTDVAIAGIYPISDASEASSQIFQRNIEQTNAQYYGFSYFDGRSPFISESNMVVRGWGVAGDVHAPTAGVLAYENVFQYWLDLFTYAGSISGSLGFAVPSTAITFPATTVNWTNNFGSTIALYIDNTGVTGSVTKKNGQQIFSSLVGDMTLSLKAGDYFSVTYTLGTPTARWEFQ